MLPEKLVRKRLNKAPRKANPEKVRTTAKDLAKGMLSPEDYEWEEMKIEGIGGSEMDWSAVIVSESLGVSVNVEVTPMQASYIICSIKDLNGMMLYPSPYQIIENLVAMFRASTNCVVIDANREDLLWGKVEMTVPGGKTLYHGMSAGDAIAFAATTGKPLYMLRGLVSRLTD